MIEYKGYVGTVQFDSAERNLYGKIVDITDHIFYEGDSVDELEQSMHDALDNYLAHCEEIGKNPTKPFSGNLRLRMEPALHARLAAEAESRGVSMNVVVVEAVSSFIGDRKSA